jgi:hypothetical protein
MATLTQQQADAAAVTAAQAAVATDYATAQAAAANANNAYTNAVTSGTATLAQLTALQQTAIAAQQQVNSLTGEAVIPALTHYQAQIAASQEELAAGTNSGTPTPAAVPGGFANEDQYLASIGLLTIPTISQGPQGLSALDPGNPDNILGPGGAPAITLNVNVNAGTVVGSNAAQQLVNLVMPQMVAQLRQAGVKI